MSQRVVTGRGRIVMLNVVKHPAQECEVYSERRRGSSADGQVLRRVQDDTVCTPRRNLPHDLGIRQVRK